jgi:hypothetical protein
MRYRLLGLAFLCLLLVSPPPASGASRDEYEVKAAFLLNFARLVDWPRDFRPKDGAPWVVAVVGDEAVLATLRKSLDGARVDDAPVAVRPVSGSDEIAGAHILFITRDGTAARKVAAAATGRPILTVGESDDFATRGGGIVNFVNRDKKLRFEINHEAARNAGLKVSSRLLRLALLVEGSG